jgi:hypothetical protein
MEAAVPAAVFGSESLSAGLAPADNSSEMTAGDNCLRTASRRGVVAGEPDDDNRG